MKGITKYSKTFPGTKRNYNLSAQYDFTDGFVGISQFEAGKLTDRILLSKKQFEELIEFVRKGR